MRLSKARLSYPLTLLISLNFRASDVLPQGRASAGKDPSSFAVPTFSRISLERVREVHTARSGLDDELAEKQAESGSCLPLERAQTDPFQRPSRPIANAAATHSKIWRLLRLVHSLVARVTSQALCEIRRRQEWISRLADAFESSLSHSLGTRESLALKGDSLRQTGSTLSGLIHNFQEASGAMGCSLRTSARAAVAIL
jgi:hypothetical protein